MTTKVHTRYRNKTGIVVPGVTTVLGLLAKPALIHWAWKLGIEGDDYRKVRDKAADIGTIAHLMIECFLKMTKPDLSEYSQASVEVASGLFLEYVKWWKDAKLKAIAVEEIVVSELWQFGGCIDLIAEDAEGKYLLLDLKTSKGIYDEYKMQLAAYKSAWEEIHPDKPISKVKVVHLSKETGDLSLHDFSDLKVYFEIFKHLRAIYVLQKRTDPKRRSDPKYRTPRRAQ